MHDLFFFFFFTENLFFLETEEYKVQKSILLQN